eukprot:GHVH01006291.1.p1 GENE.GHVH01006291.1~~GHVH01006291.1.p1  ORF type:complete len:226 (+),score=43.91 GHVH01006291.1:26-703(+)
MKLCISNPATAQHKVFEIEDEKNIASFYDKRMGQVVKADCIGPEFKGYELKITGGNDKQGFPMLQGVLVKHRVKLLMKAGMKCYRPRRRGQLKRKSVRGCIVSGDMSKLDLVIASKGADDIEGLTDEVIPARLAPRRANKIRAMFDLDKKADVAPLAELLKRTIVTKGGKTRHTQPKIRRLVTQSRIGRKARRMEEIKTRRVTNKQKVATYLATYRTPVAPKTTA